MVAFFQTLRGKLILTYTAVTVLALLALEITILLAVFAFSGGMNAPTLGYLSDVVSVLAPQARPYLQPDRRDLAGLQRWLDATYAAGYASLPPQDAFDNPAAPIVSTEPMVVISPDLTIVAAAPAGARSLVGQPYSPPDNLARSQEILDNALQLDHLSGHISARKPGGDYLMAVPVRQSQEAGPLVGVIMVTVAAPPPGMGAWRSLILQVLPATAILGLFAIVPFGALFGLIMSRGLTRRLKALTLAADAWSEGDFSIQPQDGDGDEIGYLAVRLRRMAEHLQSLLQTRRELAFLEERNRLARELHDTVKQETFATLMQVRAARNLLERDPAAARQRLEEAEALIKRSQQELGLIIAELRPGALGDKSLVAALGDYLATWSQHARIPAELQVQNEQQLPPELELTLFRVAQEALANVARHSRASAAIVRLVFDPGQVTLCVSDNGAGFDPDAASGFGLQSMHERMAAAGGRLAVHTMPQGGATILATAPTLLQEQP